MVRKYHNKIPFRTSFTEQQKREYMDFACMGSSRGYDDFVQLREFVTEKLEIYMQKGPFSDFSFNQQVDYLIFEYAEKRRHRIESDYNDDLDNVDILKNIDMFANGLC